MSRAEFYNSIRASVNLTTQNVYGFEKCLNYIADKTGSVQDKAYALATAFWETAQTMHPVIEAYWLSESWRRRHLRYYPYYGRGLIQTTWKSGYEKVGIMLNENLVDYPEKLLEWKYALPAWWFGMKNGIYTGKSLDDYIDSLDESDSEDYREYVNARKIVNGTDRAAEIARLALVFEHALKASGEGVSA